MQTTEENAARFFFEGAACGALFLRADPPLANNGRQHPPFRSHRRARATAVLMSVPRTARRQNRPLFETIRTLLMNAWAGRNPGLRTDILAHSP